MNRNSENGPHNTGTKQFYGPKTPKNSLEQEKRNEQRLADAHQTDVASSQVQYGGDERAVSSNKVKPEEYWAALKVSGIPLNIDVRGDRGDRMCPGILSTSTSGVSIREYSYIR